MRQRKKSTKVQLSDEQVARVRDFYAAFFVVSKYTDELVDQILQLDKPNSDPLVLAAVATLHAMTRLTRIAQSPRLFGLMADAKGNQVVRT
jgi:hypothetical protein